MRSFVASVCITWVTALWLTYSACIWQLNARANLHVIVVYLCCIMQCCSARQLVSCTIRYDTIRDVILTCARKPTWVSLIYHTEPTIKKCKNRKTTSRKQICSEITVNCLGNPCSETWRRKRKGYDWLWLLRVSATNKRRLLLLFLYPR